MTAMDPKIRWILVDPDGACLTQDVEDQSEWNKLSLNGVLSDIW